MFGICIPHSTERGAPDAVNDVIFHARSALLHNFVLKIWLTVGILLHFVCIVILFGLCVCF